MILTDRFSNIETINDRKGYLTNISEITNTTNYSKYTIPKEFEYRPDLISSILYGSVKYIWILTYINQFKGSKDYTSGKIIKYINRVQ
jgi:hypothetical protein